MSFEQLKEAIKSTTLAKSQAGEVDAGKIQAAAADGAAGGGGNEGGSGDGQGKAGSAAAGAGTGEGSGQGAGQGAANKKADGDGEEDELGKSLTLVLEDGTEVEALDATALVKSLQGQVGRIGAKVAGYEADITEVMTGAIGLIKQQGVVLVSLQKSFAEQGTQLAKSLETVTEQNTMISTLRSDLDAVRNEPGGRKSVVNPAQVTAESPLVKSLQNSAGQGMAPNDFLTKCLHLQKEGILGLADVAMAEAAIGSNLPVPQGITSKVFSHN